MDAEIYVFRSAIKSHIEKSPLPDEVKRMVLEECLNEQTKRTLETVQKQLAEKDKKAKKGAKQDAEGVSKN